MRIWRVEKDGYGPYAGMNTEWMDYTHPLRRPEPEAEGLKFIATYHYCGFLSTEQAFTWFPVPECRRLNELGFVLAEYEIEEKDVEASKSQAIFGLEKATKIREHNLWEALLAYRETIW